MYAVEKGDAGSYCRERNIPQYCHRWTSRERDDVSNLLVLIKKSHKAPAGRDIAVGAIHHNDDLSHTVRIREAHFCRGCQGRLKTSASLDMSVYFAPSTRMSFPY